ncbi:MAG: sugar phosphate nucleotidyltransferase [bacterium]
MENSLPAIIPAAGRGSRLLPITRYLSKPMLPLGNRPLIFYAITEALKAGCLPLAVVGAPGDQQLYDYVELIARNNPIEYVIQPEPAGLADAVLRGFRRLDIEGPAALLLPDNIVLGAAGIGEIINDYTDGLCFGTIEIDFEQAGYFGNSGAYQSKPGGGRIEKITGLQSKGNGCFRSAVSTWPARRTVGRAILPELFFEIAEKIKPQFEGEELDDVPVYRQLIEKQPATGVRLSGQVFDTGTPRRYLRLAAFIGEKNYG